MWDLKPATKKIWVGTSLNSKTKKTNYLVPDLKSKPKGFGYLSFRQQCLLYFHPLVNFSSKHLKLGQKEKFLKSKKQNKQKKTYVREDTSRNQQNGRQSFIPSLYITDNTVGVLSYVRSCWLYTCVFLEIRFCPKRSQFHAAPNMMQGTGILLTGLR